MTARYKGILVRVVRIETHRAYIVWRGMVKRVNKTDLELLIDSALIAGLLLSLALLGWLVLR
jgi:hypothetical protein